MPFQSCLSWRLSTLVQRHEPLFYLFCGQPPPRYNVVSWRWLHCCESSKFNAEHDTSNLTWYFAIEVSNSTIQLHTHVFYLHFSFSFRFRVGFCFFTLLYNYYTAVIVFSKNVELLFSSGFSPSRLDGSFFTQPQVDVQVKRKVC